MTKLLLTIHVLAAIVAIGPVTVAASMFPAAVRRGDAPTLRTLNRICRVYAALGVVLPVFGLATATSLGVLGDAWLITSIALTVVAAVVLGLVILPAQAAALPGENRPAPTATDPGGVSSAETGAAAAPQDDNVSPERSSVLVVDERARNAAAARRLGMVTGVFNLLWVTVVVLMIVRPGSTTGA